MITQQNFAKKQQFFLKTIKKKKNIVKEIVISTWYEAVGRDLFLPSKEKDFTS